MLAKVRPSGSTGATAQVVLCVYLSLLWSGCGSSAPKLDYVERLQLQSRTHHATYADAFEAGVLALRDLGYEIDLIDAQAGVISAAKSSDHQLAKIYEADDGGLPTWVWIVGAVVIVVVVAVVAVVALAGGGDDDEEEEDDDDKKEKANEPEPTIIVQGKDRENWAGSSSVRDPGGNVQSSAPALASAEKADENTKRSKPLVMTGDLPPKQGGKTRIRVTGPDRVKRRESVETEDYEAWYFEGALQVFDLVLVPDSPPEKPWYHYRMTLSLEDLGDSTTSVELDIKGSKLKGQQLKQSGAVLDPVMHEQFFSAMEHHVGIRRRATGQ